MQFFTTLSSQDFLRLQLLLKSIQESSLLFYFKQPICLKFLPNFREMVHLSEFRAFAFRSKMYYLCSAEKEVLSYAVKPLFYSLDTQRFANATFEKRTYFRGNLPTRVVFSFLENTNHTNFTNRKVHKQPTEVVQAIPLGE